MSKRPLSLLFSSISLLCVLTLIWVELEQDKISPGPIAKVHGQVPELHGSDSCELCHGELGQSLAEACSTCHAPIAEQIEGRFGFHGTLAGEPGDCGLCHQEHNGSNFQLAGEPAFRAASFPSVLEYDHRGLDFPLHGLHDGLACTSCHGNAHVALLPAGQRRFLGLDARCTSCHDDPHAGGMGTNCESCHAQTHPFDEPTAFQHPSGFPLTGGHEGLTCTVCHDPEGPWAVAALITQPPASTRGCLDCHSSPHAAAFLARFRATARLSAGASCDTCHTAEQRTFTSALQGEGQGLEWHTASGFALKDAHTAVDCAGCHKGDSFQQRFPGRSANDCTACHQDPHSGQFAPRSCSACHTAESFRQVTFDVRRHAGTNFPLEGAHARAQCSECHRGTDAELGCVRFHGLSSACSACHEDPHAGQFTSPDTVASCSDCHSDQSFLPTTFDVERHARTAFPLTGSHGAVGCFQCHVEFDQGPACVRFRGTPLNCAACHADPHAGAFAPPDQETASQRCERCHDSRSFSLVAAFDHGETGFPLSGAHAAVNCETCHPRSARPDALGRTLGRVVALEGQTRQSCENCHSDPHAGAFETRVPATLEGRTGCARCHGENSFRDLLTAFDHDAWTEFPLGRAHSTASCESCHPRTAPRADGRTFGVARTGTCSTCHTDPHVGQFSRAGRTDCRRCHTDVPTFTALEFDHDRDSRFPLDERHSLLACQACHQSASLPDGRRAVRYKPLGTTCADCHLESEVGQPRRKQGSRSEPPR